MEGEMIAFCGLACHECGARVATENDDDEKRSEVARLWSELFNTEIKAEDIHCDGCLSQNGRLFSHCHVCQIRTCATSLGAINCGHCNAYPCDKLHFIFKTAPEAKKRLDNMRSMD